MNSLRDHSRLGLWAISSYFNPARYRRRLVNYRHFRKHLSIPLVTVELSFTGAFELHEGDADILVQLHGNDVMWQKERLLNIALAYLPSECRKIVWMDADILFERADWPAAASRALDDFALVQPFSRVGHLAPTASLKAAVRDEKIDGWQSSLAFEVGNGRPILEALRLTPAAHALGKLPLENDAQHWRRRSEYAHAGFAWAARRELLQQHGFYDACIVGGGDVCLASAAYGCAHDLACRRDMTRPERQRYLPWANSFHGALGTKAAHVEGTVYHLWHGNLRDRRYLERHEILPRFRFDPFHDIVLAENKVWRWNSDKPLLHQHVRDYFASRKEDG